MSFKVEIGWGDSCALCQKGITGDPRAVHLADRRSRRDESSYIDFCGECWPKALRKISNAIAKAAEPSSEKAA